MKRTGFAVVLLAVVAGSTSAQQISQRVIDAQPAKWTTPLCNLKGTKAAENGQKALRKAIEEKDATKREALYAEAQAALAEATSIAPSDGAAWYFLGRYYLYRGDMRGLDSAWTKAVMYNESCEIDINNTRQNTWAMLANAGIEFMRAEQTDSALTLFRHANTVFRGLPHVLLQTGGVLANTGHEDSAVVYLAEAARVAALDTSYVEERRSAELNLAIVQQRLGRFQDAIRTLQGYLEWNPGNTDAERSLAVAFRGAGMEDSAKVVEARMVSAFSQMNTDSLSLDDLMAVGVGYFNGEKYQEAATTFTKLVERNPYSRDGLYNLANAYFAMKNHEQLAVYAKKVLELDPMSADALQLLAQAQREMKQQADLLQTAERLVGLPFGVEISSFTMGQTSARFIGSAVGRDAMDASGTAVPPTPVTLVFEFLDAAGQVRGTNEINIPALKAGATHEIRTEVDSPGIVGWRYHRK